MPEMPDVNGSGGGGGNPEAGLGKWSSTYAELGAWLCQAKYPDGKPIGPTKLSLWRLNGVIAAELKIADGGLKLRAVERTPDLALVALEALLRATPVPWTIDDYPIEDRTKKRRRKI